MLETARKVAWISPFPPERSGIADYSAEFVTELRRLAHVTLFVNDPAQFDVLSLNDLPRWPIESLGAKRFEFDLPIYQLGNHKLHQAIYQQAIKYPGVIFLHEGSLNALFHQLVLGDGVSTPQRELIYAGGGRGANQTAEVMAEAIDLKFVERVVDCSLGTVAHSDYVLDSISTESKLRLPFYGNPRDGVAPWPSDSTEIVFVAGGLITPAKQIDLVLDGLAQLRQDGVAARLILVGGAVPEVGLERLIAERRLEEAVTVTGFVESIEAFETWLAQGHMLLNLRNPTQGETSAVVMRAMSLGRSVIVCDHGWYGELPDSCVKIEPGSHAALVAAMREAAADLDRVKRLGSACRNEIVKHHQLKTVVAQFVSWINQTLAAAGI